MMSKAAFLAVAALTAVAAASGAAAQSQDLLKAVKERQEHMKTLGGAMKVLAGYVKSEGPSLDQARQAARMLEEHADLDIAALFPEGSTVGNSAAKADIWQNWAEFQRAAQSLPAAADKLSQTLEQGERAQIAPAFAAVGKTCGTCHDKFRQKKS